MKKYILPIILLALVALSLMGLDAQGQPTISKNQIRQKAVGFYQLDDSLKGSGATYTGRISFLTTDGTVLIADSAIYVRAGSISSLHLKSSFLDSIAKYLVDSSDYARYALSMTSGALSDSNMLSSAFRDALFGRNVYKYIYYVQNALEADSADHADLADRALIADSALTAPSNDTVNVAYRSFYADVAGVTISSDTTVGTGVVVWTSLAQAVKDSINYAADSAYYAKNIVDGSVNSINKFSSSIQTSYLPSTTQKAALAGITTLGGAPSGSSRYADSTYVSQNYVAKPYTAITGIPTQKNFSTSLGHGVSYNPSQNYWFIIDTVAGTSNNSGHHATYKLPSKTLVFPDSLAVYGKIAANLLTTQQNFYDYNGGGSASQNITFAGAAPSGGSPTVGDIYFDSTAAGSGQDTANMWIYAGGSWRIIKGTGGGGGGSGVANTITFNTYAPTGDIDADSLLRTYANGQVIIGDSILFPHNITADTIRTFGDRLGTIGAIGRGFAKVVSGQVLCDTLSPAVDGTPTNDSLYFRGRAFLPATGNINLLGSDNKPWVSLDATAIYGASVLPSRSLNHTGSIGATSLRYQSGYIDRIHADDSVVIGDLSGTYINLKGSNGQVFTNGSVAVTGTVAATGNITTSAGNLGTPNDYFVGTGGNNFYGITDNQNYAMDDACSPSDSNEIMTRSAVGSAFKHAMNYAPTDSYKVALPRYWRNLWAFVARNMPSCQTRDSLGLTVDPDLANTGSLELSPAFIDTICWRDTTSDGNTYTIPKMITPVGIDTTGRRTGKYLINETDNPLFRNEYIVSPEGRDDLGMVTGVFATIQGALNAIPNVSVRVTTTPAIVNGYGRYTVKSAYDAYIRLGSTVIDTIVATGGKRDSVLANMFYKQGSYLCPDSFTTSPYSAANARSKVWVSIDRDSIGATNTRYVFFPDTQAYNTNIYSVVIARPWTITVWPSNDRATSVISTPITIPQYAPVTIRGLGESQTVLINTADGFEAIAQPTNTTIFNHCYGATLGRLDSMAGLPITIKDMTIITRAGSTTTQAPLMLSGKVKLENLKIIAAGASGAACVVDYKGLNLSLFGAGNNSLLAQNVTIVADSDQAIYKVESPLSFESRESSYSYKGNGGRVLYSTYDLGSYNPTFYNDEIYADSITQTIPTYAFESTTTQTAKPKILKCEFIGRSEKYDGTFYVTNMYSTNYNVYQGDISVPPIKVRDQQAIFQTKKIAPK